jgi:putative peptidoglycan lipid II flippase
MRKHLIKSTTIFSSMTFISRILGFVRDMVVANVFGASGLTDAFFVAFKIPNFMRRLFAEGAFSQAFVPILSEYKSTREPEELKTLVDHTAGTLGTILLLVTVVGVAASPLLIMLFSPGFSQDGVRFPLASHMLRITFPYIFFISLTALSAGILNTHNRFAAPAFTPVFLNLSMIAAAILLAPHLQHPIEALAWGVFVGGFVQLLFQYPFLKKLQLVPRFKWMWRDPGVQRILKLMLPAILGVSVVQIGLLIDTIFASFLPQGSISWLYNAERLMMFPLGVFGVAIASVVLPHLAKVHAKGEEDEYGKAMNWSVQTVLFIGVPAAIGLVLLSGPLLTSLFNYGQFTQHDVIMAQRALVAYGIGVPFMMLVKVLASGFYARKNIKTPVKIAIVALTINVSFNFILIGPLQHAGLALASSIAAFSNTALLLFFLLRKNIFTWDKTWGMFIVRLCIAAVVMGLGLYYFNPAQSQWFSWHWPQRFLHLFALVLGSVILYLGLLRALGFKLALRNAR